MQSLFFVLKAYPFSSVAWTRMGGLMVRAGDEESAYVCFQNAVLRDRGRVAALLGLATIYHRRGHERQALVHLRGALAVDPSNTPLADQIAEMEQQLDDKR